MTKSYILAMDIAQKSALAQLSRADGTKLWRGPLAAALDGWNGLLTTLAQHGTKPGELGVILEATGIYHVAWAERLTQAGADVYVLNPLLAARLESFANALRQHKTDAVDVARLSEIARLHASQLERFRYRGDPQRSARRQLDRTRQKLRETLTNLRKSLQGHLELVFPALLAAEITPWSARGRKILGRALTAGAWQALPAAERQKLAATKTAALDQACAGTLADEAVASACAVAVRNLLAAEQALAEQLQHCEQDVAARRAPERVKLIMSIPGYGEHTATVLDTYLPSDLTLWGARKKIVARLQALFGTDPRLRSSGQWVGKVKMSKRGIGAARTALYQAAFCSLRADPENARYYEQLRQRGKDHRAAIVDLMRKQLRRLVAVLAAGQPFRPRPSCAAA